MMSNKSFNLSFKMKLNKINKKFKTNNQKQQIKVHKNLINNQIKNNNNKNNNSNNNKNNNYNRIPMISQMRIVIILSKFCKIWILLN